MKAYFAPPRFAKWTVWFTLAIAAVVVWQGDVVAYVLGALALAAPAWAVRRWFKRPRDAQFDRWKGEALDKVLQRSLEKISLERDDHVSDKQVYIETPESGAVVGAFRGLLSGHDGFIRYTPIHFTVFIFTEHKLAIYQCAFDLTTGRELDERVDEYFYKDIVSFSAESRIVTIHRKELHRRLRGHRHRRQILKRLRERMVDGQVQVKIGETMVLTTSGADRLQVALQDPQFADDLEGLSLPSGPAEKSVAVIRKMLQERHAA